MVPMAAGGMGPRAFTASCYFALVSFSRASEGARASDRAAGCPWGAPWGRGARVEVRQVWFVGGVVPMAAGGMGPRAFAASCSFALASSARASGGARALDRAAGCAWGVPWGLKQDRVPLIGQKEAFLFCIYGQQPGEVESNTQV